MAEFVIPQTVEGKYMYHACNELLFLLVVADS